MQLFENFFRKDQSSYPLSQDTHSHYMKPLDGIRGLACLIVIISHIGPLLHLGYEKDASLYGALGVLLFFSLSGFLMSTLYFDDAFTLQKATKYTISRFSRIAPTYWIAVLLVWIIYQFLPNFIYQMPLSAVGKAFLFNSNQGVFWSIKPEVEFYIFFLALWFCGWQARRGQWIYFLLISILSVFWISQRAEWDYMALPAKLHIFLLGAATAYLVKRPLVRKFLCVPAVQIILMTMIVAYGIYFITLENVNRDLLLPALVALWIASMSVSTWFNRPFEGSAMGVIGAASFSIYLLHFPILNVVHDLEWVSAEPGPFNIMIMVIISLVPGIVFHFLVEKRINLIAKGKMTMAAELLLPQIDYVWNNVRRRCRRFVK